MPTPVPGSAAITGRVQRALADPNHRQTAAAFAIKSFGAVASFAFSYAIARLFGAAGTGSFALALTTATIASTLSLFGLDYILLRTVAGDVRVGDTATAGGTVRKVAMIVAGIAIAMAILLSVAGVPVLVRILDHSRDPGVLRLAGLAVLPLALARVAATALRGAGSIVMAQWFDGPMAMLITLATLAGMFATGTLGDVRQLFIVYTAAAAIGTTMAWGAYRRRTRGWAPPADVPARPMLSKSWRISLTVLAALVADWVILLLLGASHGRVEVGQFRTAWQVTALVTLVVVTLDTVSGPRMAAAGRVGDTAGIRSIWRQSAIIMTLGSLPLLIVALAFPHWILGLFGPEFVAAATALRILALGQLVNITTGSVGAVLLMTGREHWSLRLALLSLAVLTVAGVLLIPAYGITGAAIATALGVAVRNGTMTVLVLRQLRVRPPAAL